jgi:DNA polymerase-3 subunit epsilon
VTALRSPQLSFDELGTPLREVTFVVLDLETTGGAPTTDAITEVGAVKVRGGERLAELATLVDPGTGVPPHIAALTGITTAMIADAPRLPVHSEPPWAEPARGAGSWAGWAVRPRSVEPEVD